MDMKQAVWIVGGLVGFLVVVGMGLSVGKVLSLDRNMSAIEERLAVVEESSETTGAKLKVGAVLVNELGNRLQADPEIKGQLEALQRQLQQIQLDFQNKRISEQQATEQSQKITEEFTKYSQENLLRPIQTAVNQIGLSGDYDLIVKVEDVILFSKSSTMENITEPVWQQMQANRGR